MHLKNKIKSGQTVLGSWITLGHAAIAEIFAKSGCDWVTVDLEHSVIDLDMAQALIRTIDLCGNSPIVRLSSLDPVQIKRVLDAGAHGVIAPNIKTGAEAKQLIQAVYYPPKGTRGVGLARAQGYGASFKDYVKKFEENAVVMIQIEHIDAVNNLEEILSVSGIDGFLIGPYDLSASLGEPGNFSNPKYIEAMAKINSTAKRMGMPSGIHVVEPNFDAVRQASKDGFQLIAYTVDIRILETAMRCLTEKL